LTFAAIGEVHIGAFYKNEDYLRQALKKAKERKVDFVVVLGDLTQNGSFQEYSILKNILDESGVRYFVVPGNHDIGSESGEEGLRNFRQFFGDTYREVLFPLGAQGKIKRARLFLLDTAQWRGNGVTTIGSAQWKWLKEKLGNKGFDTSELKLVFSQMPFDRFSLTDVHYIRQFICESFADGFFEADLHRTERFVRNCPVPLYNEQMENVSFAFPTFKVGALFKPRGEFPGFLVVHYFDNRFFEAERIILGPLNEKDQ